jgi:hypothetical protein
MSKPEELSDEAKEAKTTEDLWSLFFTDTILDKIVQYTNEKIDEDVQKKQLTAEQLRRFPHMQQIDKVLVHLFLTTKLFFLVDSNSVGIQAGLMRFGSVL